jgi:hypothetical protein
MTTVGWPLPTAAPMASGTPGPMAAELGRSEVRGARIGSSRSAQR